MEYLQKIIYAVPRRAWIVATVGWMIFIFFLSGRQRVSVSDQYWANFFVFKALHIIEYFILMFLNVLAVTQNTHNLHYRKSLRYAFFISILFALSDEIHQTFVPTREGTLRDVLIDAIGITFVYWFASRYERISKNTA